ncbi:hypothetical protein PLESTB_001429300 [Pleodorina starrii]|uniref:Uncharacterized protein n=1 Tax=Pleodorina starrii TaxID=330485 RepID=A0A9W6F7X0_9CHLO|nr:hypothetical protein PLESTB_001429300 [Pleodorina starrii]GLC67664.1 hypothetical protein PLESTF_000588500 [Pleodorina starrii]
MVWSLAEHYVHFSAATPAPQGFPDSSASQPPSTPTNSREGSDPPTATASVTIATTPIREAAADSKDATASPSPPPAPSGAGAAAAVATTAVGGGGALSRSSSRRSEAPLPLPSGIGPVGLSNPSSSASSFSPKVPGSSPGERFRRATLCLLAKGRRELRKGLHAAEEQHQDTPAAAAAAGTSALDPIPARPSEPRSGNLGNFQVELLVSDAVAEVLPAASPASRALVRRRVRGVVAGLSVMYTAANIGAAAVALAHADFAHDFSSSAKAVLDFMFTAPSVTGIASELLQIGVAVGLGMAQRGRPPC